MSQLRHTASRVCQDKASGVVAEVMGLSRDHEFTDAIDDIIYPTRICSGAICSSQVMGAAHNWANEVGIGLTSSGIEVGIT